VRLPPAGLTGEAGLWTARRSRRSGNREPAPVDRPGWYKRYSAPRTAEERVRHHHHPETGPRYDQQTQCGGSAVSRAR